MLNTVVYWVSDDAKKVEAMYYDPFIKKNNERGFIYTLKLPDDLLKSKAFWNIFNKRQLNVHGYPLRVCIFGYAGTCSPVFDSNNTLIRYKLRDGNLIDSIAKTINFTPIYFTPTDGLTYGGALNNGTLLGSILDIDSGVADILGNIRPIKSYGQANAQFLFPADEMKFTFLVPKMDEDFAVSFLRIYDTATSFALFSMFLATALIWYVLQNVNLRIKSNFYVPHFLEEHLDRDLMRTEDILQMLFGIMLQVSQKSRRKIYERCLFISVVLFSMIVSYTYQGN